VRRFSKRLAGRRYHDKLPKISCFITFLVFFVFLFYSEGFSADGLKWGRFRLSPVLSLSEIYTDNIYLVQTGEQDDTITTISPTLSIDFALAPLHYITLKYEGNYRLYAESDNFKEDIHRFDLFWSLTTSKGSTFKLGGRANFDSIQPYSPEGRHKDFEEKEAYADILAAVGAFTDVGIRYSHLSRRFDDSIFSIDDFDMDKITLKILYKKFPVTSPLIEYTFYHYDGNDFLDRSTDMDTSIFLIGAQWEPTAKLSGYLKGGYYKSELENGDDSSGFAMDTNVTYRLTDPARISLTLFRRVVQSTRAARETGDYYVSTGGTVLITYLGLDPFTLTIDATYQNNEFEQELSLPDEDRTDNYYRAGIHIKYSPRDWLSFGLGYSYRRNNTDFEPDEYRENRIQADVSLAM
jgi:hypothetical protein